MHKATDIEKAAEIVMSNLKLMSTAKKKCIVVEGSTDESLLSKYLCPDVYCCSVSTKTRSNDVFFSGKPEPNEQDHENHKKTISTLIDCKNHYPNLFNWPRGFLTIPIYGLIDKDFDGYEKYNGNPWLAATFTHDLETLIVATAGESILSELPGYRFTAEDVNNALCIAYQLALLRKAINDYNKSDRADKDSSELKKILSDSGSEEREESGTHIQQRWFSDGNGVVQYSEFTDGLSIDAAKAIGFILSCPKDRFPSIIKRRIKNGVFKFLDRDLDNNGRFKINSEAFTPAKAEGFYEIVNGHDIMSALIYLNPKLSNLYAQMSRRGLNRDLELSLIRHYTANYYRCFCDNPTYKKLLAMDVVKEIDK